MAIMVRISPIAAPGGATAKSAVYNAAAATYGVCLVTEIALLIGTNAVITNRLKLSTTLNILEGIFDRFLKKKRTTTSLPTATDRVLLACSMTPAGLFKSPTNYVRSVVAAATAPVETDVGIVIGSTVYGTTAGVGQTERSRLMEHAFDAALNAYKMNFSRKA